MTAFPPPHYDFPFNQALLESDDPKDMVEFQKQLTRKLSDVTTNISNSIYGETGKWLPVAQGASTAGSGTYEVQVGHYVRSGNMCWFTLNLQWDDSNHTGTGNLEITGLPVAAFNLTNAKVVFPCYNSQSAGEFVGMAFVNPGAKKISIIKSGATTQQINGADFELQISGSYRVL